MMPFLYHTLLIVYLLHPNLAKYVSNPTSADISSHLKSTNNASPSCFTEDSTFTSSSLIGTFSNIASAPACQSLCATTPGCSHFTWYTPEAQAIDLICFLYSQPNSPDTCSDCVSGPRSCFCSSGFACEVEEDNLLDIATNIQSEADCQGLCASSEPCRFYTWYNENAHPYKFMCFLFKSCGKQDFSVTDCLSGPADCSDIIILPTTTNKPTTTTTKRPATTTTKPTTVKTTQTTTKAIPSSSTPSPYPSCYRQDMTWATANMIGPPHHADTFYICQEVCIENIKCDCSHFTWLSQKKLCKLYDHPTRETVCTGPCVSGPIDCAIPVVTTVDPSIPGCPYPKDPCKGEYHCPTDSPDGNVQVGHVCYLTCYEGMYGGHILCKQDGTYDESNLNGC